MTLRRATNNDISTIMEIERQPGLNIWSATLRAGYTKN
jgi:hypothetical protein